MKRLFISCCLVLSGYMVQGRVMLSALISDNMVLQQQASPALWGSADSRMAITVVTSWNNKSYTIKPDANNNWRVNVKTPIAGGPYQIMITQGANKQVIRNILVGEVWFCSGQSNMGMPMRGFKNQPILNSNDILLEAQNNNLRLFEVGSANARLPQIDCKGQWKKSTPETAREFSAVAYQFGSMLQKQLNVPVGLILSAVGGTMIESWMSRKSLAQFPEAQWPPEADTIRQPYKAGAALFNGMVAPVVGYDIKGFLWFQGESNRHEPYTYGKLFPAMVADWRSRWNTGHALPFYYAQIAPYAGQDPNRSAARLREAQLRDMDIIPDAGMAVTLDLGIQKYIHFTDKTAVSKRLLYWALAKTYNVKGITCASPVYKSISVTDNKAVLTFGNADNGLTSFAKELTNFEIAGADKIFYSAKAFINADGTITVTSNMVKVPVAVRYGFHEWVAGDLYNTEGLPASSFRTDNWD